jgi:hypothetical protein
VLHASFLPSLRRRDVPRYVAHNGLTRRFPCSSLAVDTLFGNGFPVSADFSRSETVADPEFYRVIPVERADIIVIESIYYTDGSRPVLFYKAEELIRFGPSSCSTTPGVTGTAWREQRNEIPDPPRRRPGTRRASVDGRLLLPRRQAASPGREIRGLRLGWGSCPKGNRHRSPLGAWYSTSARQVLDRPGG